MTLFVRFSIHQNVYVECAESCPPLPDPEAATLAPSVRMDNQPGLRHTLREKRDFYDERRILSRSKRDSP